jgi:RimJ/RimL family protein N-acetyltransferase
MVISLQQFGENDFDRLIAEVPDARFLLQWSGPKYTHPLDATQLQDTLEKATGDNPAFYVFKAVLPETLETVGHIQLMNIDYEAAKCTLGRVLMFKEHRGKGFGKELVAMAVQEAFENLNLNEVMLSVFDFNAIAIAAYKSIGFVEYQFEEAARSFRNEKWNIIKMKINKGNRPPIEPTFSERMPKKS